MSQNDLVIDNQSFPATRSDINSALQALGSLSSGSAAPATTYANMLWYDTINNTLKMRSEANDQWISVAYVDQSANAFRIFDDTQVVNTSGTQTGLLGDQATATWEAGIGTTESLVSPANVKAAVVALTPTVDTSSVLSAMAGASAGAIGSVAFLRANINSDVAFGGTLAGSSLTPAGVSGTGVTFSTRTTSSGAAQSGTWRCLGFSDWVDLEADLDGFTLWLRIS